MKCLKKKGELRMGEIENNSGNTKAEKQSNRELVDRLTREFIEKHELFQDTQKQPWIAINGSGSHVMNLKEENFRYWVMKQAMEANGDFISTHTADEIAKRLISIALFNNINPKPLEVRIVRKDRIDGSPEEFWYDLCDKNGLAVHITKDGYKIEEPPIIFRRYDHQHEQIKPKAKLGGKWDDIFDIINFTKRDDRVAFTVFCISCFISRFPKPILLIQGTNGSGKSTPMRILHNLIDPSELESGTALVRDTAELARQANKLCLIHWDNIDGREITPEVSNALCRLTSGQSFMRRTLYQDDGDSIFKGQRAIMLNGIGKLVEREDILDRSLILTTQRIPENKRKTEATIFSRLQEMKPYLLHEIFTVLTRVITIYPTVNLRTSHRMADFEALGYAICEALDSYSGKEWLDVYGRVVRRQVDTALEESATAQIAKYLVDRSAGHWWEGTATDMRGFEFRKDDFYIETDADKSIKDQIKDNPSFPRSPSALSAQLNRAESTLRALGITIDHDIKNGMRLIILKDINNYEPNKKPEDALENIDKMFDELPF